MTPSASTSAKSKITNFLTCDLAKTSEGLLSCYRSGPPMKTCKPIFSVPSSGALSQLRRGAKLGFTGYRCAQENSASIDSTGTQRA
jgi:hypothetical protein